MKVLVFLHCWSEPRQLLPPYDNFIDGFLSLGCDVEIIWSNEISDLLNTLSSKVREDSIVSFIREMKPDLVVSCNNGGMTKKIRQTVKCPVVKWLFDDFPHLFFPNKEMDIAESLRPGDKVVCYSTNLQKQISRMQPGLKDYTTFSPHAITFLPRAKPDDPFTYNISFIGSALNYGELRNLLRHYDSRDVGLAKQIIAATEALRLDYNRLFSEIITEYELGKLFNDLGEYGWDPQFLRRVMSDAISSQDRTSAILALSGLGLALFGNVGWLDSVMYSLDIAKSYQFGRAIQKSADAMEIYNCSKIAIDIPNIQNINALSNRVFDVMSSASLLVTKYQKESDLINLFGNECPVLMYNDNDHLRDICKYYLTHEDERNDIVLKCNDLVKSGHTYADRIAGVFQRMSIERPINPQKGYIKCIDSQIFLKH